MADQALKYIADAEKLGPKIEGVAVQPVEIKKVGIIGSGLMGGGIGMCCAEAGMKVVMVDMNKEGLERGMKIIEGNFKRSKRMSDEQKKACIDNMSGTIDMADCHDCDLVVEAVFEDMSVKKDIFSKLDKICKPSAFLCTNTSFLNIDEMASCTSRPQNFMGTHFFSPANVMKLLENVRGAKTSEVCVASMMHWGTRLKKNCILVNNCHGFVGNRMVQFYSGNARKLMEIGSAPQDVDMAAMKFGMAMGPIAMSDMVGLDLGVQALKTAGTFDPKTVIDHALVDQGRLGQKNKMGFYEYDDNRKPSPSAAVAEILRQVRENKGVKAETVSDEQKLEYLFYPMINEGFKILEEGIAQRPSDIDVCYTNGYSFPKKRGGPMYYADQIGLPKVKATLEKMGIVPAKLLVECAGSGKSLADFWASRTPVSKL